MNTIQEYQDKEQQGKHEDEDEYEYEEPEPNIVDDIENDMCKICVNYFTKNIVLLRDLPDYANTTDITYKVHEIMITMIEDCPFTAIETELIEILIENHNYNIDSKQFIGYINITELIKDLEYLANKLYDI